MREVMFYLWLLAVGTVIGLLGKAGFALAASSRDTAQTYLSIAAFVSMLGTLPMIVVIRSYRQELKDVE